MKADLRQTVLTMLGADGAFARAVSSWQVSEEQLDYASRVCELLTARDRRGDSRAAVGTLEAATGIGKTFGYLVPLLVYAHRTGRRVAVATFTLDLLHSLQSEAVPAATRIVAEELGAPVLKSALRVGMPEFVSLQRVQELLIAIPPGHAATAALQALAKFAQASHGGATSGLLRDWLAAGYALPPSISADQVRLMPWCDTEDQGAYRLQSERAGQADIVLTTQASLLMHCMGRMDVTSGVDDLPAIDSVVVDEADRVSSMAEAVAGTYLPMQPLVALLRDLDNGRRPAVTKARKQVAASIDALQSAIPDSGVRRVLLHGTKGAWAREKVLASLSHLKEAFTVIRRQSIVREDAELADRIGRWADQMRLFTRALDGDGGLRASFLLQSPVRGCLGLGVVAIDPGRILSQLWKSEVDEGGVRALLLTSATLAPPGEAGMSSFHREVGIIPGEHRLIQEACGQIEPHHHGQMALVMADPRAPRPFGRSQTEGVEINPEWVQYVGNMIRKANAQGGRCLVLCGAYRDTSAIAEHLREVGLEPIEGKRGNRAEEVDAFLNDPSAIWITPSAWEGVDLPGAIQHLIVARIPYVSLEEGSAAAFREILMARGLDGATANRIVASRNRGRVARQLRQGLGRPLRRRDDQATVWIADSRFPLPLSIRDTWLRQHRQHRREQVGQGDVALAGVIPARFRAVQPQILNIENELWSPS